MFETLFYWAFIFLLQKQHLVSIIEPYFLYFSLFLFLFLSLSVCTSIFLIGTQSQSAVHGFRPHHQDWEGLRRPQEVHTAHPLWPRWQAHPLGTQHPPQWRKCHILAWWARGRHSEGHHVGAHGVRSEWSHQLANFRGREVVDLHISGEGVKACTVDCSCLYLPLMTVLTKLLHCKSVVRFVWHWSENSFYSKGHHT